MKRNYLRVTGVCHGDWRYQYSGVDWMDRGDHTVVYSNGTLFGEWPDGFRFSGNRYLDRFKVRDGKIPHMDVWNDSAEWLLVPEIAKE